MKINENGIVREMTEAEEDEYRQRFGESVPKQPLSEKVDELEAAMLALIGGDTE